MGARPAAAAHGLPGLPALAMDETSASPEPDDALPPTSLHVRRAAGGDAESLSWIVGRFSPLLLAQARYRMGGVLRNAYDPEDVVNEVWAAALPRLAGLQARDGRHTPVLMKFLSTTLLYHVNNLLRRQCVREGPEPAPAAPTASELGAEATGVLSRAVRDELRGLVLEALDALSEDDRRILVLRGFEQRPNQEVAEALGLLPNTVAVRYRRALEKLRRELPGSIFAELDDGG